MRLIIRFALWFVAHTIFKVSVVGRENAPLRGPALLVSNHVSYADGFLIASLVPLIVRFMVWKPFFGVIGVNWILRMIKAIPVGVGPFDTAVAIRRARAELIAGHIVCMFPEGSITRTGHLMPFNRGMEKIAEGLDIPIVPVRLDQLWGSVFSFEQGKFFWKWPRHVPHPVTISFGRPMAASSTAYEIREVIQGLGAEAAVPKREHALLS